MSVRRRKTNLFLYVLFLMLLASFAFYPNEAKATGTGATATEIYTTIQVKPYRSPEDWNLFGLM